MTDKEIIIDGVDVGECDHLKYDHIGCDIDETYCLGSDCYFKQLKRKEQECEKLKKEINGYKIISEQIRQEVQEDVTCESRECGCDSYEECIECLKNTILNIIDEGNDFVQGRVICKECSKYKKALEEIESLCKNEACAPCKELEENDHCDECYGKIILDIINKVKNGELNSEWNIDIG